MNERFERMERCLRPETTVEELIGALRDADWNVRLAAVVGLEERHDPRAIEPLLEVLRVENAAPIYSQQYDFCGAGAGWTHVEAPRFPENTTDELRAAWRRRGRIKQAVCYALGAIGRADERALEFLHRYVTDQNEDYGIRAAAGKALGALRHPSSRPYLERATEDSEWCTKTEAKKALAALAGSVP